MSPVVFPMRVAIELSGVGDFEDQLRESVARMDDAYWARYVMRPFTWQRYINWWIARRWVRPRDIRKEP